MGSLLIILGLVVALLLSWTLGILMILIGIVLLFAPVPYGRSYHRGR